MRHIARCFLVASALALTTTPSLACGGSTPCLLEDGRSYRVYVPETVADSPRAIMFAHGYGGNARGTMSSRALRGAADELGVLLIALQAPGRGWSLAHAPSNARDRDADTDEIAYVDAVVADVSTRFGVKAQDMVVSGFSLGGMVAWTIACHRGDAFAGYIPLSGVFWAPIPDRCTAPPASIIHIHGTTDKVVPLEGRPIGDAYQGDVGEVFEMYRQHGAFSPEDPVAHPSLTCDVARNATAQRLELCLFDGGHSYSKAHLKSAYQRLMNAE